MIKFRFLKTAIGYTLQYLQQGEPRGEFTEQNWVDVPVQDATGLTIGYEINGTPTDSKV